MDVMDIKCTKCHKLKPPSSFFRRNYDGKRGYCSHCKDCRRKASGEHRHKNHNHYLQYGRDYRKHMNAQFQKYREKYARILKDEFIMNMGGKCACCGESNPKFLTLDHINNDGHKDIYPSGSRRRSLQIIRELRRMGWPKDVYQILCFNCNCARAFNGGVCPHRNAK